MERCNALPHRWRGYTIDHWKRGRFFQVLDRDQVLVCVCVYRKGAIEVVRRLSAQEMEASSEQD